MNKLLLIAAMALSFNAVAGQQVDYISVNINAYSSVTIPLDTIKNIKGIKVCSRLNSDSSNFLTIAELKDKYNAGLWGDNISGNDCSNLERFGDGLEYDGVAKLKLSCVSNGFNNTPCIVKAYIYH